MRHKFRWAVFLICVGVILNFYTYKIEAMGDSSQSYDENFESFVVPDFTLPDLEGDPFVFSTLKGKIVLVDFWATWCPPCLEEIPSFIQLKDKYKDQGFDILGISLDEEVPGVVKPFSERMQMNYPIVMGNDEVINLFGGIIGLPTLFVVDREGHVVQRFIGYVDKETIEKTIKKYL